MPGIARFVTMLIAVLGVFTWVEYSVIAGITQAWRATMNAACWC